MACWPYPIQPGTVRTAMAEELMQSYAGKRWLPWFQQYFDSGQDVGTKPAEELILHLASGAADQLSGRIFFADPPSPPGVLRLHY